MQEFSDFWGQADAVGRAVAALLLLMSISAWVVIFWKGWVLRRAQRDLARAVPAFWDAGTLDDGRARLGRMDREGAAAAAARRGHACAPAAARCRPRAGSIRS